MPLRLVNPQPMDTLPQDGEVFVGWQYQWSGGASDLFVKDQDVSEIRIFMKKYPDVVVYHAWSDTAKIERD